ncbi:MAG TPA: SDR family NAD(P)-dependent oxidoreductase [Acidimicrobiales bacterium]|nr:SDR family NAD(P)-dependent oxidoreductase [Acidimicrobiales bacterium]
MDLRGKRVLVTGASRGIGLRLAERFVERGASVALVARNEVLLKEVASRIGGTVHPTNLSNPDEVRGLVSRVEAEGGPIDVLVNNAGLDNVGPLERASEEQVAELMRVNLLAPMELCRQVVPGMVSRGAGHIVNISSMASSAMYPGGTAYGASKAGLSHFTEILRWEMKGTKVGLTLVELGPIPTDMLDHVKSYRPTEAGFARGYKLQLIVDVPAEAVARETVEAVEKNKRAVRLPRRAVLFPMLRAAPQRMVRLLTAGIPNR